MKLLGKVDAQSGTLKEGLQPLSSLPSKAAVNTICNLNGVLYKCKSLLNGSPVWASLDARPVVYTFTQTATSKTWTIKHDLATLLPLLQCYDSTNKLIAYSSAVSSADGNTLTVTFSASQKGSAVVVSLA